MTDRRHLTVLLLEDQPLIAMDTDAMLRRMGFADVVHLTSVARALDWLSAGQPDLAVMETSLQGEDSGPVAELLTARKVPLLFYSGANRSMIDREKRAAGSWVSKPSEVEILEPAIVQLLSRL
jgi:CheY-like chemotaxis protein